MPYHHRSIETTIQAAVRQRPAVILTGPRQSGKTTLLKNLFGESHRYVTLDDPDMRILAVKEPKMFLANYPAPVIIDEIQHAPQLLSYL